MDKNSELFNNIDVSDQLPFILGYLVEYVGATDPTTSGTYDNVDAADVA